MSANLKFVGFFVLDRLLIIKYSYTNNKRTHLHLRELSVLSDNDSKAFDLNQQNAVYQYNRLHFFCYGCLFVYICIVIKKIYSLI